MRKDLEDKWRKWFDENPEKLDDEEISVGGSLNSIHPEEVVVTRPLIGENQTIIVSR